MAYVLGNTIFTAFHVALIGASVTYVAHLTIGHTTHTLESHVRLPKTAILDTPQ